MTFGDALGRATLSAAEQYEVLCACVDVATTEPSGSLTWTAPPLPTKSAEQREWLERVLGAHGFVAAEGTLALSEELISVLHQERNDARRRLHAEAEAAREKLLSKLLHSTFDSAAAAKRPSSGGRAHMRRALGAVNSFLERHAREPACWPALNGVSTLFEAQATSAEELTWCCDRETLLNGGDAFVEHIVPLLGELALTPPASALSTAEEGRASNQLDWVIRSDAWAPIEMKASTPSLPPPYPIPTPFLPQPYPSPLSPPLRHPYPTPTLFLPHPYPIPTPPLPPTPTPHSYPTPTPHPYPSPLPPNPTPHPYPPPLPPTPTPHPPAPAC